MPGSERPGDGAVKKAGKGLLLLDMVAWCENSSSSPPVLNRWWNWGLGSHNEGVMEAELNPGLADGEACVPAMYKDARGSGTENGIELETSCMSTV